MKGIVLAGGKGTRLYPMTLAVSKQLMPIYDKPLIYYPISTLMLAGIKDILIISTEKDLPLFKELLGDGSKIGMHFEYLPQEEPKGIAEAFIIGEEFIGNDSVMLVLGDNVFYGMGLSQMLIDAIDNNKDGATVFATQVANPEDFGIVYFDENDKIIKIEEKPKNPTSNYAIPGLYIYDNSVIEKAKQVGLSNRGELEITDVNKEYFKDGKLKLHKLWRGFAWLDTGTPEGLLNASTFVETLQKRQGLQVSCLEEIAWRKGFITTEQFKQIGEDLKMTSYGKYILNLIKNN